MVGQVGHAIAQGVQLRLAQTSADRREELKLLREKIKHEEVKDKICQTRLLQFERAQQLALLSAADSVEATETSAQNWG